MIRITQLKLPVDHSLEMLTKKIMDMLHIASREEMSYEIIRQSLDARKKPDLYYVYTVDVSLPAKMEVRILKRKKKSQLSFIKREQYQIPQRIKGQPGKRPVIAGSGPAGLFCAWLMARCGLAPIILERGAAVEERAEAVERFWKTGQLDCECNVQFGEGGAGTFSDGKLNTSVKDPKGRNRQVLQMFVDAGASPEILYQQKPHLGTDQLIDIVKTLRHQIEEMGGTFYFHTCLTDLCLRENRLTAIQINRHQWIETDVLVCAIGHSARDTFQMLHQHGVFMSAKSFAVGVRVEHPQEMINLSQYGSKSHAALGAAPYKLTHQTSSGRGVYTFCMCPGGYVVNASSEPGRLAVNGMSYHDRNSDNANSAVIVTVSPEDFESYADPKIPDALKGIAFQRWLEERAYQAADGAIPVQKFQDFCDKKASTKLGEIIPCMQGAYKMADVRGIFPEFIGAELEEGIRAFGRKIKGFDRADCLISGVESRSSSPVRVEREPSFVSSVAGLYPCGEGAGYAGGITSAAIDGLKVAEAVIGRYQKLSDES